MDRKIENLLDELCVQQGFCLSLKERDRIASQGAWEADSFARDIITSEGLNPEYETRHFRDIRNKFIEVFGSAEYRDSNS